MVVTQDTGGIANEDTLLLTKKVRWKDMEKWMQAKNQTEWSAKLENLFIVSLLITKSKWAAQLS